MLIESYRLELVVSTHSVEHFSYEATAHLATDIGPAIPYLNAALPGGIYVPDAPALGWRCEGHKVGFWPDRIAVDDLESRQQAQEVVQRLVDLVNRTWERRAELTPDTTAHPRLQPLELYRLLPRTNCRRCGEATCFNFALKLATAQAHLEHCLPLFEEAGWENQRAQLQELLATRWPAL